MIDELFSDPPWADAKTLAFIERGNYVIDPTPCSDCGLQIRLAGTTVNATATEPQARYCFGCWKDRDTRSDLACVREARPGEPSHAIGWNQEDPPDRVD